MDFPHILLAEDEALVAVSLVHMLEGEGYRVTAAWNGQEALEVEAKDPPDLLVTDMRMPVMDGRTLIERIRQRRPELPIVVMTGYSELIPAEEPGRLLVLHKPFLMSLLMNNIRSMLEG